MLRMTRIYFKSTMKFLIWESLQSINQPIKFIGFYLTFTFLHRYYIHHFGNAFVNSESSKCDTGVFYFAADFSGEVS